MQGQAAPPAKIVRLQGPPHLLERLTKVKLCVAGSIFKIQPSKFQNQNILDICFHVVELADVSVLELLFEEHVIFLLEISGSLSFDLVVGNLSLKLVAPLFVTLALDLALGPLLVAFFVTLDLGCGQFLLKYLLLELLLIAFLTQSLGIVSLGFFLIYLALHLVHLNLILSLFEF